MQKNSILKVFTNINENIPKNCVVSIGFFDGVHKGHVYLLEQLIQEAELQEQEDLVISLWPHPAKFFGKEISLLNTLEEKIELIGKVGVKNLLVLPFDFNIASLSSDQFVEKVLKDQLFCSSILMGYNNNFGNKNIISKPESEYVLPVKRLGKYEFDNFNNINSSQIRECISKGNIVKASEMLNYNYKLQGKIISGYQIGRKIGFPTANLKVNDTDKLQPGNGVYIIKAIFNKSSYPAMLSKGTRPSFNGKEVSIEFHIPNFQGNLYGEEVEVEFLQKIRDEEKFENIDDLIKAIEKDKEITLSYFSKYL